jgi:hypothetical protein
VRLFRGSRLRNRRGSWRIISGEGENVGEKFSIDKGSWS